MPKSSHKSVCNLFYGYQVDEIVRVCVVSKATAQHFKRGSRLPSPQAQRLWWLHIQGRVLPMEWRRFRVHKDSLVDEAGNFYREGEVAAIPFFRQKIAELYRQLDKGLYARAVSEVQCEGLVEALRILLQEGRQVLDTMERIPRRRPQAAQECEMGGVHTVTTTK